jgi:Arc/MetJ-type ribon-helix-helix transcriptional regulator
MTIREQEIQQGTLIEVLWSVEGSEVWWGATVERVERIEDVCGTRVVACDIAYEADHGHDVTRASVVLHDDGKLEEGDETMRWRLQGDEGVDDEFIDDPSRSASDVIRMALAQAMEERSDAEQRMLASRVSDALSTFRDVMAATLRGLGDAEEVDEKMVQGIIARMESKMDDKAMSEGGSEGSL